ncbi:MAG: methionine adenosyltransferase [Bacillota bacterium]|nr:methionine adenosyltransferase [Bacillota bacterium]
MPMTRLFTSESVTEGHPDKIADAVSDAVLDAMLAQDKNSRVACETFVTTGLVLVSGEITTECYIDIPHLVREVIRDIGYTRAKYGFDCDTCAVMTAIDEQSGDIALGVDKALEQKLGDTDAYASIGAGDQGMMFGYACDDTPELMPLPIYLAHQLTRKMAAVRKSDPHSPMLPDGKSQVTVEYDDNDRPLRVDTVVISTQHRAEVSLEELRPFIIEQVIKSTIPAELLDQRTRYLVNPTGRFVIGGPQGDTGLTGRKIIVDTYGGMSRHGGGAFSGKDPTKVDRSASYMARYMAKNIVAAGLAARCEVQLSYAIGVAEPLSLNVDCFGTAKVFEQKLVQALRQVFDARPAAIIEQFELRRPIYRRITNYGHFGRPELDLPWERVDKTEALLAALK